LLSTSDLPLSLSLTTFRLEGDRELTSGTVRDALALAAASRCEAVQLSATIPGLRPRELDRSARRDLAAAIRRAGLGFSGLDLIIPPEHFRQPEHQDRAVAAIFQACELAAELSGLLPGLGGASVSTVLDPATPLAVRKELAESASRSGCVLCELNWPPLSDQTELGVPPGSAVGGLPAPPAVGPAISGSPYRCGLDPAALLMGGIDPVVTGTRLGAALSHPRLSDVSTVGRIAPGGSGARLDLMGYRIALSAAGYAGPVILDLRGVHDPWRAAAGAATAWRESVPAFGALTGGSGYRPG
jgi:sugar phosphate isomerase/epimerase